MIKMMSAVCTCMHLWVEMNCRGQMRETVCRLCTKTEICIHMSLSDLWSCVCTWFCFIDLSHCGTGVHVHKPYFHSHNWLEIDVKTHLITRLLMKTSAFPPLVRPDNDKNGKEVEFYQLCHIDKVLCILHFIIYCVCIINITLTARFSNFQNT